MTRWSSCGLIGLDSPWDDGEGRMIDLLSTGKSRPWQRTLRSQCGNSPSRAREASPLGLYILAGTSLWHLFIMIKTVTPPDCLYYI